MAIQVSAPAKINLALDVVGKLPNGYHLLEMVMQTISLCDRLTIDRAPAVAIHCDRAEVPSDRSNIVWQAWQLMQSAYDLPDGISVEIEKQIPMAGGLAGGSADGAATLIAIDRLFGLGLTVEELCEHAARLGSDVPFCVRQGTALATGTGVELEPLPPCPQLGVLVVNPGFAVGTVEVYRHLRWQEVEAHPDLAAMLAALRAQSSSGVLANLGNVLETSSFELFPALAVLKQEIADFGVAAMMSGSGGTMLGLSTDRERLDHAAERLRGKYPFVGVYETIQAI